MNILQTLPRSNEFAKIKHSLDRWVQQVIIDVDPFDQSSIQSQILLKEWDLSQEGTTEI